MEFRESKITSKFQLTLPKLVREVLGVREGDTVAFLVEDKNVLVVPKPADPLKALAKLGEGGRFPEVRKEIKEARKEGKRG